MDGFKNSTRTQYFKGGEAKVGKVMGEFKAGTLHSGSKKGPAVENPKQAIAIALSEARKAPMKKAQGGYIANEPTPFVSSDDDTDTSSMADSGTSRVASRTPVRLSFGDAFKAARAAGKQTFTWHGKSYTTEIATSKPAAAPPRANPIKAYSSEPVVKPSSPASSKPSAPTRSEIFKKAFSDSMGSDKPASAYRAEADARSAAVVNAAKRASSAVRGALSQTRQDLEANKKRSFSQNMRRQLSDDPGYAQGGMVKREASDRTVSVQKPTSTRVETTSHRSMAKTMPKAKGFNNEAYVTKPVDTLNGTYGYAKGGKVVEKGSGEVYASKAAQKRHEAKESPAQERREHRKQAGGPVTMQDANVEAAQAAGLQSMRGYRKGGTPKYRVGGKVPC